MCTVPVAVAVVVRALMNHMRWCVYRGGVNTTAQQVPNAADISSGQVRTLWEQTTTNSLAHPYKHTPSHTRTHLLLRQPTQYGRVGRGCMRGHSTMTVVRFGTVMMAGLVKRRPSKRHDLATVCMIVGHCMRVRVCVHVGRVTGCGGPNGVSHRFTGRVSVA
jgi:hypothetical protein